MTEELINTDVTEVVETEDTQVTEKTPINWAKTKDLKKKDIKEGLAKLRDKIKSANKKGFKEEADTSAAAFSQIYREPRSIIRKKIRSYNRFLGKQIAEANLTTEQPPMKEMLTVLKQKLYFIAEEGTTLQDELMVLGALEGLALSRPEYTIYFGSVRQDVYEIAKASWFIEKTYRVENTDTLKSIAGDNTFLEISEPDILAAAEAEKERFDADFEKLVQEKKKYFEDARKAGVKDLKEDLPEYSFGPQWSKTEGYLWQITQDLGISLDLPVKIKISKNDGRLHNTINEKEVKLTPFIKVNADTRRLILKTLKNQIPSNQDYVVVDFENDPAKFSLYSSVGTSFPNAKLITVKSLQQASKKLGRGKDVDLTVLATALQEPNCVAVVGSYGVLPYAAWAAGVTNICMLYDGNNTEWDTIDVKNKFILQRPLYEDGNIGQAVAMALGYMNKTPE